MSGGNLCPPHLFESLDGGIKITTMRFVIKKTDKRDLEKMVPFGTCNGEREGNETRTLLTTIPFGPYVLDKPTDCWPDELVAEYREFSNSK